MKYIIFLISSIFLILSGIIYSCRNEEIPTLTTTEITSITTTSAVSGGNIIDDGGAEITSRGVCWNTTGNPTIVNNRTLDGTGNEPFESILTQLVPDTYYCLRAYATNRSGTGYGNEHCFATMEISTGSVTDIDGNTYNTVMIGEQVWMAENLKTTRFNDNTDIPLIQGDSEWKSLITTGLCWYNNDSSTYKSDYGALYNWYAVASRKLCPTGWHVPSSAEWSEMADQLGGENAVRNKIKEPGVTHWIRPDAGATNESGFTALPGGARINGAFEGIGIAGAWWSATVHDVDYAWYLELDDDISYLLEGKSGKSQGFSVRCVKN